MYLIVLECVCVCVYVVFAQFVHHYPFGGVVWHSFLTVCATDIIYTIQLCDLLKYYFDMIFKKTCTDGGSQVISGDQKIGYGNLWLGSASNHIEPPSYAWASPFHYFLNKVVKMWLLAILVIIIKYSYFCRCIS